MIKSMTAYAGAERRSQSLMVSTEIRSYNSRYLDIIPRLPQTYLSLEDRIKGLVSEKLKRGRVELKIQIRDESEAACAFEVDGERARAYHRAVSDLQALLDLDPEPVPLSVILGAGGMIKPAETVCDPEAQWPLIRDCLDEALAGLDRMRQREGEFIRRDFAERLGLLSDLLDRIAAGASGLMEMYQTRLKERIAALTEGMADIDPSRLAQEAAFLADKSDISEEIVRAHSHITQFAAIMENDEPGGRKLNFLLQEFNREFNTIGAKAAKAELSHLVVESKSVLEQLREQVQNVE